MGLAEYKAWKEKQDKLKEEQTRWTNAKQSQSLRDFTSQYGGEIDPDNFINFGNGLRYNPETGGYNVGGSSFGYDPTKNISSIGNIGFEGELDPRIASDMTDADYESVLSEIEKYSKEFEQYYTDYINKNKAYSVTTSTSGEQTANSAVHIDTIKEALKKDNPELYEKVAPFVGTREDEQQKAYLKKVYDLAAGRVKEPYSESYSSMLKNQWTEANKGLASSQSSTDWDNRIKTSELNKQMNNELNAIYKNPALQGYVRNQQLDAIKKKYGSQISALTSAPQQQGVKPNVLTQPVPTNVTPTIPTETPVTPPPSPTPDPTIQPALENARMSYMNGQSTPTSNPDTTALATAMTNLAEGQNLPKESTSFSNAYSQYYPSLGGVKRTKQTVPGTQNPESVGQFSGK